MSYNTQEALLPAVRQIARQVDLIVNTLACSHATWLSLMAHLASTRKAIHALPFADNKAAIAAVDPLCAQVRS
ncbi:hypothetical protein [Xanthomonas arboricola]|uniref:hypothetical protein n=1 Tax=Xanthomonas arboricola TaxID=56448 RepID=UPI000CEE422A|nr:hypothetical protein [Xanthomonas arboricola]MBB6575417.1 hypothetical protein [Xanthomonas arboricola]PPT86734.1 hypothetical protein XarbCFBP8149_16055 [Xanthomonas arboricola]PPU47855.1 hypothetical protein XarbCFBP7697_03475 [Xanthomonas arboricola]